MNVKELVAQMTLEEKAGMCSGADFWHLKGVERLGIPSVMVTDGPHGLRKQDQSGDHLGINDSVKAVCFPTASALACSFDRDLLFELGKALGEECQAEDVSVILGPGANIKRSPLCGRNFEYFSEDPYLSSEMAASHISGVQSQNVGTSLKHFAANNQEYRRMTSSSEVDERTLREIYLASFEGAVKKGRPWTVMCSYNKINGVYSSENYKLLTEILRNEWGFDGYVVSDWGAVNDRVEGLKAGLDLEMPSSGGVNDELIVKAVKDGRLDEKVLDRAVERILTIIFKYVENKKNISSYDKKAHHELARKISSECMVLLKNDGILPLKKGAKIAFIGKFAASPRYQGGGSSHINSFMVSNALEAANGIAKISYAKGYETNEDVIDENLIKEAVNTAKNAEVAVIFAGLPDKFESEGYDREHMSMPNCQNKLIEEICKVQPNTVIVLHNGSPVEMPWIDKVKAVLEVYLGGQAVGEATVDVLFGDKNPCGKLAESFPKRLEDNPSYLFFKGEKDKVEYREGVFVGYRYYDKKKIDVLFPFGHGLSYTTFEYSDLKLDKKEMLDSETLSVSVKVKNTGKTAGKEIVQLYVKNAKGIAIRPEKELKGFKKIELAPGEEKTVSFVLDKRAFAYYNTDISDWYAPTGTYQILIGKSSRDIVLTGDVLVKSTAKIPIKLSLTSTIGDAMEIPEARPFIEKLLSKNVLTGTDSDKDALGESTAEMMEKMMNEMPLRALVSFAGGALSIEDLQKTIDEINQKVNKA